VPAPPFVPGACVTVCGAELVFGLGFWGESLPVAGTAGDSGLAGGGGADKKTTLNFAQWVWPLGQVALGVCGGVPQTRGP
jgi:hypothetical protein